MSTAAPGSPRPGAHAPRGESAALADRDQLLAEYRLHVNGSARTCAVEPETPLVCVLRESLGLMGTEYGCGTARCGACTTLLGPHGEPAAVDHQLRARDVRGLVGGQEQHGVGDFLHASRAPHRDAREHLLAEGGIGGGLRGGHRRQHPGCTEFTRMPFRANCTAADLVISRTAPFDAL